MHQQPRACTADLPLIEPNRVNQPFDRAIQIGVIKHDVRRLAAQLQSQRLARACRRLTNAAPHGGGAGKGDLVDILMGNNHLAHSAITGDNVNHTLRQSSLTANVSKKQRRQRSILRRLQHHRVAHRQRRRDFPRQHQQREVPRNDLSTHPKRLRIGQLTLHQLRHAGVVIEMPLRQRHIDITRLTDRLAVVQYLQHGKEPRVFLQQPRQRIDMTRPAMAAQLLPLPLRFSRGLHGAIDIALRRLRQAGQNLSRCRVGAVETRARRGERPINEMTKTPALIHDPSQRICRRFRGWPVFHALKNLRHAHAFILFQIPSRSLQQAQEVA